MILIDTGPIVALLDPADTAHQRCVEVLQSIEEPLLTTEPVLTEAFHLLTPDSIGARRLMDFIAEGGMEISSLDAEGLSRAFELMLHYSDQPMDFADASLVVAAEQARLRKIFSIDRTDFDVYRVKRGHRHYALERIG